RSISAILHSHPNRRPIANPSFLLYAGRHERVSRQLGKRKPARATHGRARRARGRFGGDVCPLRRARRPERKQNLHLRDVAPPPQPAASEVSGHTSAGTEPIPRPPPLAR